MDRKLVQIIVAQFERLTSEIGTKQLDYHMFGIGSDGSFWKFSFDQNRWVRLSSIPIAEANGGS